MNWQEEHKDWKGGFDNLIEIVNNILSTEYKDIKLINSRLARHYQQTGVLSKGVKEGRSSVFDYNDICSLITAKSMVKEGWSLRHTAQYINSPLFEDSSSFVVQDKKSAYKSKKSTSLSASDLVSQLILDSSKEMPNGSCRVDSGLGDDKRIKRDNLFSTLSTSKASVVEKVEVSSWLSVYLDADKMSNATRKDKDQAYKGLLEIANKIIKF